MATLILKTLLLTLAALTSLIVGALVVLIWQGTQPIKCVRCQKEFRPTWRAAVGEVFYGRFNSHCGPCCEWGASEKEARHASTPNPQTP